MPIKRKNLVFPINIIILLSIWSFVLLRYGDLSSLLNYWMYPLTMVFGAILAGLTPLGGGMVAYPVLSLYFDIDPATARDFSLAIQAMGMTSASVYIMSRKKFKNDYIKYLPYFIFLNFLGFIFGSGLYDGISKPLVQLIFVSFSLSFVGVYLYTKNNVQANVIKIKKTEKKRVICLTFLLCFFGGIISSFFGTGSDIFLYVLLTMYLNLKEKISTDFSIILMAAISILGFFYKFLVFGIETNIVNMWLAAVPVVIFFAPFGNKLLKFIRRKYFLYLILFLTGFNWLYFLNKVGDYLLYSLLLIAIFSIGLLLLKPNKVKITVDKS
jgi:uncharacterized membrane protein YfcA